MKILLIGHSVEDHLLSNGKEAVTPGGIFYSALGYEMICKKENEISLNTSIEKNNEHLFSEVYDKLNKKYISVEKEIPNVFLTLYENKERDECYNKITKNLEVNLDDLNLFDGIHINMITGFDISINQLEGIRKIFKGMIYIDIHTLARGLDSDMKRNFRTIPNFEKWANAVDIIQVNEEELLTLDEEKDPQKIIYSVLNYGLKFIIVTKGKSGAKVYWLINEELNSVFVNAKKLNTDSTPFLKNKNNYPIKNLPARGCALPNFNRENVSTETGSREMTIKNYESKTNRQVGCGDIFGSVFFYFYLKTNDLTAALTKANDIAGLVSTKNNLDDLLKMRNNVFA